MSYRNNWAIQGRDATRWCAPHRSSFQIHNGMIVYTHIFNLFAKFLLVAAAVSVVVVLITLDVPISGGFLFIVSFLVTVALLWPVYYFLLRHLANWLYCTLILRTILSWSDLKKVACLFDFDREGGWIPMTEILALVNRKMNRDDAYG